MERRAYLPLLGAALLLFGFGALLQAVELIVGGWPTLLGLQLAGFAVPFLAWALWARRSVRRPEPPWPARYASAIGVPLMAGALVANALATGVESTVTKRMTWQVSPGEGGAAPEVVLRFADAPDHMVGLHSRAVADYLLGLEAPVVDVAFVLTRDWGRLRSHRIARIGTLDRWRSATGWSGCSGGCAGSPW